MTYKSMVFKKRINGQIIWADIEIATIPTQKGTVSIAKAIVIDIPKLLPMEMFLKDFEEGFKTQGINPQINWDALELIELQIKPKGLIISLNSMN